MKKILLILLFVTGMVNAQTVNIPDQFFKAKLLEAGTAVPIAMDAGGNNIKIDTNEDGEIQASEALTVYRLRIGNSTILNLTGIASFTNLTHLECFGNILFNLDISALTNLVSLNCSNNYLTSLNMSNQPNLTQLFCDNNQIANIVGLGHLTRFSCMANQLTSLDMTNSPNLEIFLCQGNQLSSLNISGLSNLKMVYAGNNNLTTINLSGLANLENANFDYNQLTSIVTPTPLPNLNSLTVFYNQLTSLNLVNIPNLVSLSCGENSIAVLDLAGQHNLAALECDHMPDNFVVNGQDLTSVLNFDYTGSHPNLTLNGFPNVQNLNVNINKPSVTLNVSGLGANTNLRFLYPSMTTLTVNGTGTTLMESLNCQGNQIENLHLNGLTNLKGLNCGINKLTSLDLSNLPNLERLEVGRNKIQTLNIAGLNNLKHLDCNNNKISVLDVSGLTALEYLDCSNDVSVDIVGNQITTLDVANLVNLKHLDCSNYHMAGAIGAAGNLVGSLALDNLTQLEVLNCVKNNLGTLSVNNLTQLKELNCAQNLLTSLDLIGLSSLTKLYYYGNQLSNLNMTDLVNLTELDCSSNQIETLTVSQMPNLKILYCAYNELTTLDISMLTQLEIFDCTQNQLTSIDISALPALVSLGCSTNQLGSLDLSTATELISLVCVGNQLTTLDVSNSPNLQLLNCAGNLLTNLDLGTLADLGELHCDVNALTNLDLSNNPLIRYLSCGQNNLTALNVQNLTQLLSVSCYSNALSSLDVSQSPHLYSVYCHNNQLTTLDVSTATNLEALRCDNNLLETLFIKNGSTELELNLSNNPTLQYVCADEAEVASVQTQLNTLGMASTVCNTYCSVSPGGPHNTVTGTTIFDGNNNGCNANDPLHPNIRVDINDGNGIGSAFTNTEGICTFYTDSGNFTIYPNIENASAFNISPAQATISFPDNNYNTSNQSFCLSANGVHPDVEVVVTPIGPARPGFDAEYKIVFKNKGNQILAGTIDMTYEEPKIDFISSSPAADTQSDGSLSFAYSNLLPFESRAIDLVFNVNSPLETPPVNNDDILLFGASITPTSGDETPADNQFTMSQVVVGPFDPNDKTCLEGASVSTSMIGEYLHYNINFENLGTAAAVNVVIKDEIDTNTFDINTLQVIYSSHEMRASIRGNKVEFIFTDINLAPADGDPPVGGHGNVLFKIKTLTTLTEGSMAENTASIFFDYNAPIETNIARTTFESLSTPGTELDETVSIYPNPSNGIVTVKSTSEVKSLELFDVQGRLLQTNLNEDQIDLSPRSTGLYFLRIKTDKGISVQKVGRK